MDNEISSCNKKISQMCDTLIRIDEGIKSYIELRKNLPDHLMPPLKKKIKHWKVKTLQDYEGGMISLLRKISRALRSRMDEIIQEICQEKQKNPLQQTTRRRILSDSLQKILDLLVLITIHT